MDGNLPVIAGIVSTSFFLLSEVPMLNKAFRTKDLASYSPGNILMANMGNVVHSVYVFNLPFGPIWLLHSFYVLSAALMLIWYLRYEGRSPFSLQIPALRLATVASPFLTIHHEAARSERDAAGAMRPHPELRMRLAATDEYPASIPHPGNDREHLAR